MKISIPARTLFVIALMIISLNGFAQTPQGKWTFDDQAKLHAASPGLGQDLLLVGQDSAITGPADGNGAVRIPVGTHYKLTHGFAPNGGGTGLPLRVNEYSLMIDFRIPDLTRWYTLFQTDTANSNDGDCFIKKTTGYVGTGDNGYSTVAVTPGEWHRMVIAVRNGSQHNFYLNGSLLHAGTALAIDSGRFALDKALLLFADDDGDDGVIDVAEVRIWNTLLTSSQVAGLGSIVPTIPQKFMAKWTFDNPSNLTGAVVGYGTDLVRGGLGKDSAVAGPSGGNGAARVPRGSHYVLTHGFMPNGGGADSMHRVNEYSVMIDFLIPDLTKWYTLFQTNPANTDDGDCFVKPTSGQIGTAATGYSTTGAKAGTWHRLVLSVKNGAHHNYYLDGQIICTGTASALDSRFALDSVVLMFGDDDGDDGDIDVAELRLWNYPLTATEAAGLGTVFVDSLLVRKWTFDEPANLHAAAPGFGRALVLSGNDSSIAGPTVANKAVRVPKGSYLTAIHDFKPNGGGADSLARINEYSVMIDFRVPDLARWYNFFQTDTTNSTDGDCFIKPTTGVVGTFGTGYSDVGVTPAVWHRLIVAVKNGVFHNYYLDGTLLKAGTAAPIDDRYSLSKSLLLLADDDGDDGEMDVAEVRVWNYPLPARDVTALGSVVVTDVRTEPVTGPAEFALAQNYPNPFNPSTSIRFSVPSDGWVTLKVYNLLGQEVATLVNQHLRGGTHTTVFNGSNLASGVYLYALEADHHTAARKLMLVK